MDHRPLRGIRAPETSHACSGISSYFASALPWVGLLLLLFSQHLSCSGVSLAFPWAPPGAPPVVLCLLWHPSFSGISSYLVVITFLKYVFAEEPYAPFIVSVLVHN